MTTFFPRKPPPPDQERRDQAVSVTATVLLHAALLGGLLLLKPDAPTFRPPTRQELKTAPMEVVTLAPADIPDALPTAALTPEQRRNAPVNSRNPVNPRNASAATSPKPVAQVPTPAPTPTPAPVKPA